MYAVLTAFSVFSGLLLALTGAFLAGAAGTGATVQVTQVSHVAIGLAAILPMFWLTLRHARRGRNVLALLSGGLLVVCCLAGVVIVVLAVLGAGGGAIAALVHLATAIGLALFTLLHVAAAVRISGDAPWIRTSGLPAMGAAFLALGFVAAAGAYLEQRAVMPPPAQYDMPYGDDAPFAPANTTLMGSEFVAPARLAGSAMCGSCHQEIYAQWSQSMHRYSATDPHVEVGIRWFQRENGPAAGRLCAGCHNPIMLLAGRFDSATTPIEGGTAPHPEGISCLSCHSIQTVHQDPLGNGSYAIKPPDVPVVGAGAIANALIRFDPAEHGAAMMRRPLFQSAEFCGSCHQQYIPVALGGPGPSEMENQYPEWKDSDFPGTKTCNDCHMPLVKADDPAAKDGKVHSHRFVGANHAHAVASGHEEQARLTLEFLNNAIDLSVRGLPSAKPQHVDIEVRVTNSGAGHSFPSGTTDISQVWVELIVGDPNEPIFTSGLLDSRSYLDPGARVYRKLLRDASLLPVDLHNLATVHDTPIDRHIKPGQTDVLRYHVPVGDKTSGVLFVRARLRMRKANQRWTDWLTNFDGATVTITDIESAVTSLDLAAIGVLPPHEVTPTPPAVVETAPPVPGMAFVPGGKAVIGLDDGDSDEAPKHEVEVAAFYIDRYPVTNSAYRRFVRATGRRGPVHLIPWAEEYSWKGQEYPPGKADMAVILVLLQDARDYCRWLGKRLPTETEWEKSARGPDGRRYPWGDRWEDGACPHLADADLPPRVGMCPKRKSPYGVQDQVGGVWEWTSSPYLAYPRTFLHPNDNEWINNFGDSMMSVRGSPAGMVGPHTTAASRVGQADNQRQKVGFRCARDGPAKTAQYSMDNP